MAGMIRVIGLGAGDLDQMPLGIYRKLKEAEHLFVRTKEHPVLAALATEGVVFEAFDAVYEAHEKFEDVYQAIVNRLFIEASDKQIVYGVPGHPLVAEQTVQMLIEKSEAHGVKLVIEGGQSFLDAMFTALKIDPIEGCQIVDATAFQISEIEMRHHLIIVQVYDEFVASDVKLALMEKYPDDYEVVVMVAAGSQDEQLIRVPLFELDRTVKLNNLTSLYVPPVHSEMIRYHEFSKLREVIAELRGPDGCPWDKEQTHESLKKYLVEETYEVLEAIDEEDDDHLIEELGDVLLQVMLHAQIGEDEGMFNIQDVIRSITEKMIRRHPHVFAEANAQTSEEVVRNWEEIKRQEKGNEQRESLLDGVPKALPGLMAAYKLQKKAAKVGFDWPEIDQIWDKVKEELNEFRQEINHGNHNLAINEFGDLLFALVNVGRYYKIEPEEALRMTNDKFRHRFHYIEIEVAKQGKVLSEMTLEEMDKLWEEAKH